MPTFYHPLPDHLVEQVSVYLGAQDLFIQNMELQNSQAKTHHINPLRMIQILKTPEFPCSVGKNPFLHLKIDAD